MTIRYLSIDEVLVIHEEMVLLFGGAMEVHDFALLHSAVERPKATFGGEDLYKTLFEKAAALIHSLILNHPFTDGNKRTSITSCARFLYINGYRLNLPFKESHRVVIDIDAKRVDFDGIVMWLKKHSKKVK